MFARQSAQDRVIQVKENWKWLKDEVLKLREDAAGFRINAGSLQHGGAHPPHKAHRNGSMFDLGLGQPGEFKYPLRPSPMQIPASQPLISPESVRDNPSNTISLAELLEAVQRMFPLLDEPDELESGATITDGSTFRSQDFVFPPGGLENREGVKVPYAEIALRFVQAMLLTFPSQILYASWATLRDAQSDLIDRVDNAESVLTRGGRSLNPVETTALTFFRKRLGTRPPVDRPSSGKFGVLFPRDDHADHWHISYRPGDVDASDVHRDTALRWLEQHRHLLWPPPKSTP